MTLFILSFIVFVISALIAERITSNYRATNLYFTFAEIDYNIGELPIELEQS